MTLALSKMIAAIGDDNVELQNLDQCATSLNAASGVTKITFGTSQLLTLTGTDKLGLVLWVDRERVAEIVAASKAEAAA